MRNINIMLAPVLEQVLLVRDVGVTTEEIIALFSYVKAVADGGRREGGTERNFFCN